MCCEPHGGDPNKVNGTCPDCGEDTHDCDSVDICGHTPDIECHTCGHAPCDQYC
jgi:hypothetical protein